jgi:hypothetical protein
VHISFTKQITRNEREEGAVEAVVRAKSTELRIPTEITIRFNDLRLWIDKRNLMGRTKVHILQGITVNFEPGKLNVIMGPSGLSLPRTRVNSRKRQDDITEYSLQTTPWIFDGKISLFRRLAFQ